MKEKVRLLAGKLEKNLHSVSPGNFFQKNLKRLPLRKFWPQKFLKGNSSHKYPVKNNCITPHWKNNFDISQYFYVSNKFLPNSIPISFFNELRDGFCASWCKSSSRNRKCIKQATKLNSEMDFSNSRSYCEIPFSVTV